MDQEQPVIKQSSRFWKIIRRFFLWTVTSVLLLAGAAVALVFIYEDEVKQAVINELNKHLNAEIKIDPKNIDFTILKTFPNAAVEFKDAMAYEALKKKERDTLFTAGLISLQFDVMEIFNGNYKINTIRLNDALLNMKVDKQGNENYIFWKSDTAASPGETVEFRLEKIELGNIQVKYKNRKAFVKVIARIEEAVVSGEFHEKNYALKSDGKLFVEELTMDKRNLLNTKEITYAFDVDVTGNKFTIKNADVAINKLSLAASGALDISDTALMADLGIKGKNIDVRSTLSLLPQVHQDKIKDYQSDGLFYIDGKLKGNLKRPEQLMIQSEFGIQNATITYGPDGTRLEKVNLNGKYKKDNQHPEKLELNNISAKLNQEEIKGNFALTSFNDPYIELDAQGNLKLEDLQRFYPIDTISSVSGAVKFNVYINGSASELKNNFSEHNEKSHGEAELSNVKLKVKHDDKEITIPAGKLALQGNDISMESISIQAGKNDALINGTLRNFIGWLLKDDQHLTAEAKLESNFISIDELLAAPAGEPGVSPAKPYEL